MEALAPQYLLDVRDDPAARIRDFRLEVSDRRLRGAPFRGQSSRDTPHDDDLRTDYDVVVSAPAGETISDRAIAEIERVLRGEADPDQPDGKGHRADFFVPKTHEPAVAVPALAAVLRQLGLPPATQVYWTGCDGDMPLAELDQ
ncbi:hypothetical protein [Actinoallomurus rhizosphaericola]|uniref:hypothetical protein n=1 Tax=Actinoallomurus rhizosphaericola TaxID=2952536 RepID=UPI002093410C|nr:hypothetical protein [Actinoallomurus rhizosphaericola]MCO5996673.1 hypothetical protein [Actinoallomurus rhizosphaericola]